MSLERRVRFLELVVMFEGLLIILLMWRL